MKRIIDLLLLIPKILGEATFAGIQLFPRDPVVFRLAPVAACMLRVSPAILSLQFMAAFPSRMA